MVGGVDSDKETAGTGADVNEASVAEAPLVIEATDFSPLDPNAKSAGSGVKVSTVVVVLALLVSSIILWFLLSAKTLVVDVKPVDATVDIDGLSFRLSGNFLLRQGVYDIKASAEGYYDNTQKIKVADADNQRLEIELEKLPGHLQITSQPMGADVIIDGNIVGKTPYLAMSLSPDQHEIQMALSRYKRFSAVVDIEGLDKTQQLSAELEPDWGIASLNTEPSGAVVSVNDEARGTTPLDIEVLSSGEPVTVKLAGHKQWQSQLQVDAGSNKVFPLIQLEPSDGLLTVASNPTKASVTVNGQFRGLTPLELELMPEEKHKLRFFLDGYQSVSRSIALYSGTEKALSIELVPLQGEVRILTTPAAADIYIDGKRVGSSGQSFVLTTKAHSLEVRKSGYATHRRTIMPQTDIEQVLQIALQTEKQARWANTPKKIETSVGQRLKLFRPMQTFTMGASRREAGRRSNEVLREVSLERAFYLSDTPVTNYQYKQFNSKHSSNHASGTTLDTPRQPVVSISWQQAALYCNWLSKQESLDPFYIEKDGKIVDVNSESTGYRLPSEAEWSWAARYSNNGMLKFPWGSSYPPTNVAGNYADRSGAKILAKVLVNYNDGYVGSSPVSKFPPNDKGLYDLGSNIAEWVGDYYGIELGLSLKKEVDPLGPDEGTYRVIRGASWRESGMTELRLSFRDYGNDGRDDLGFRVARYAE